MRKNTSTPQYPGAPPPPIAPLSKAPSHFLREAYLKRRSHNPAYSTRAFARQLGVSQPFLSLLLNDKRRLALDTAIRISGILQMEDATREEFLVAVAMHSQNDQRSKAFLFDRLLNGAASQEALHRASLDLDRRKALGDWHSVALLDLVTTDGFDPAPRWIARRLGVSEHQVIDSLERLLRLGLIEKTGSGYRKVDRHLYTDTERSEECIRGFHRQVIGKALEQLDLPGEKDFRRRDISCMSFAIDPSKLDQARKRIRKFKDDMSKLLTQGEITEVYQMNVQLFPLTAEISETKGRSS
jgi:uncharacterized protein (TIGR02147 family)